MESILIHHGILGQKWGVRRFQNKDGTLTSAGKQRAVYRRRTISSDKTSKDVNEIIGSMNKYDRDRVLAGSDHYLNFEEGSSVAKRVLKKVGTKPVAFFDVLEDGDTLQVALGTHNDYRGRGYGSEVTRKAMKWVDNNIDKIGQKQIVWGVKTDNVGSIRIAEKNGFVKDNKSYSKDKTWVNYVKKLH